jgi:predicted ATPase
LIDEPELGLHPFAIKLLAELMKANSTRAQVLVATQSVTLLNLLEPEHVFVTEHDGVKTKVEWLPHRFEEGKLQEWLSEYAIGELWEKNVLGGRPR